MQLQVRGVKQTLIAAARWTGQDGQPYRHRGARLGEETSVRVSATSSTWVVVALGVW